MPEVTAEIIEMGDVRYEAIGDNQVRTLPRGVVLQFSSVEEFKAAVTGNARVRFEWPTTTVSPR